MSMHWFFAKILFPINLNTDRLPWQHKRPLFEYYKREKSQIIHIPLVEFSEISHNYFVHGEPWNEYIS